jgi:hypothetical protein
MLTAGVSTADKIRSHANKIYLRLTRKRLKYNIWCFNQYYSYIYTRQKNMNYLKKMLVYFY